MAKRSSKPTNSTSDSQTTGGLAYTREALAQMASDVLGYARTVGASDAAVEVSEGCGLSVSVRMGELENVERNRDKSVGVTVYVGQRRGSASSSDFSADALKQTVQAAYDIARFTAEDPAAGLPDAEQLASAEEAARDFDLYHPWDIDADEAKALALRCEDAARGVDKRIRNSEGAGVSAQQAQFWMANSRGFAGGLASSRHSLSVSVIAGKGDGMQRDSWYSSERSAGDMASPEAVGRYAAERALSRLKSRKVPTGEVAVLFEAPVAAGLLGAYVQATSGGALYRKTTFLLDCLGQQIWADHIDVDEDPFIARAKGTGAFDDEGVRTHARRVVDGGRPQGYFLGTYSARKLGLTTTGNAGGSHNLHLTSRHTRPGDDLRAMIKKLHRGLFVTELIGQGVNYVTGDYSRGAAGFWVEGGEIAFPVDEVTIASNLKDMLRGVQAVGADAYTLGAKRCGSVLVERMTLAGE